MSGRRNHHKILLLNYGSNTNNSFHHQWNLANALVQNGCECLIACQKIQGARDQPPAPDSTPSPQVLSFKSLEALIEQNSPSGYQPDIVHAWTPRENVRQLVFRLFEHLPSAALIVHLEDNEEELLRRGAPLAMENPKAFVHLENYPHFLNLCDGITTIVDPLKKFVPTGIPSLTLPPIVHPQTLDAETDSKFRLQVREKIGCDEGVFIVGYTGNDNIANREDIRTLYRAIHSLFQSGCPVVLVRTGISNPEFKTDLGFDTSLFCKDLGLVDWELIPHVLQACCVLVQPGVADEYNSYRLPSKLPEYLLSGRPVVCAAYSGLSIQHESNAILLENGSPAELADKLSYLWKNPDLRERLASAGQQLGNRLFSDPLRPKSVLEFYDHCLQMSKERSGLRYRSSTQDSPPLLPPRAHEWPSIRFFLLREQSQRALLETGHHALLKEMKKSEYRGMLHKAAYNEIRLTWFWRLFGPLISAERRIRRLTIPPNVRANDRSKKTRKSDESENDFSALAINLEAELSYETLQKRYTALKRRHEKLKRKFELEKASKSFSAMTFDSWLTQVEPMRIDAYHHHLPIKWHPSSWGPKERIRSSSELPSLSIVTPSYNQGAFIEKTIRSVLDQNYPRLEYVIQDGGSKDGTLAILEKYADRLHAWESAPDRGQTAAINTGFSKTSGEIMAWLNSDDQLMPGTLNRVADFFARNPRVDVLYGYRAIVDEKDRMIGHWVFPPIHGKEIIEMVDFIPQETLFWRRNLWDLAGGKLNEEYHFAMDWELILRFLKSGGRFHLIPEFLGIFRAHAEQKSRLLINDIGDKEMKRLRLKFRGDKIDWAEFKRLFLKLQRRAKIRSLWMRFRRRLPEYTELDEPILND